MVRIMKLACMAAFLVGVIAGPALGKRSPPPNVPPVKYGELELRAPHGMMGCVEAVEPTRGTRAWFRQIYVIQRDLRLETDVQDVYISQMRMLPERSVLEVTNEQGGVFELDLTTFEIKVLKGSAVLRRK